MTVYDIPNINHCTVVPIGNPAVGYRINSNEGWYIHINDGDEETQNVYKTAVALNANFDFSTVEIIAAADLPADAEIWAVGDETETM